MIIETIGHSDRYSVEQMSCLFYRMDDEIKITSVFADDKVLTKVFSKDAVFEEEYKADNSDIKSFKNSVKKSAYLAMKKATEKEAPWGVLAGIRPTKFCRDLAKDHSCEEVRDILIKDYWVSEKKADFCLEVTKKSTDIIKSIKPGEIGLYIGVPFCPSRCSYCSFISESAALYSKYIPEYAEALIKEIESTALFAKEKGLTVTSFYIGGGTPPSLGVNLLSEVIDKAVSAFHINPSSVEFTVEVGRADVINEDLLKMLKEKSVSRICINPQTMNDETLKLIRRNHNAGDVIKAFELARKWDFDNINSDLIIGLPGENHNMFLNTLKEIKKLSPEGITVHSMYLKRASEMNKGKCFDSCGKDIEKMLLTSVEFAKEEGYIPYYMYKQRSTLGNLENTGYAKEGFESLYNCAIMEECATILALGAGASTKIVKSNNEIERVYNIKDAFSYIRDIDKVIEDKINKMDLIFGKKQ